MYGGKRIFLTGIAATSILTMVTPLSTWAGTGFLIAVRFLEGLFEGMTYPSIHAIWSRLGGHSHQNAQSRPILILFRWAPPLEQSRITAFAFSGGAKILELGIKFNTCQASNVPKI